MSNDSETTFVIQQTVRCGATTCAVTAGDFCAWVQTAPRSFGQDFQCGIFRDEDGRPVRLYDHGVPHGWLKRCNQCFAAQKEAQK